MKFFESSSLADFSRAGAKPLQRLVLRAWLPAAGMVLALGAATAAQAQPGCNLPPPDVGHQFPGPPAHDDLRKSLAMPKACVQKVRQRRLSGRELQDLRRAVRSQSQLQHVGDRTPAPPGR